MDPGVKPGHWLLLKSAVLVHSAKACEESVVQVESEVYNNCKVSFCIVLEGDKSTVSICEGCHLPCGCGRRDYHQLVDILIPHNHLQADPDGSHFFYFFG